MPQGGFKDAKAQAAARASAGFDDFWYLKLKDGDRAQVRFLLAEEEFVWAWMHEAPPRGRAKWGDDEPCCDQQGDGSSACPACERGIDRYFVGYEPLIWRNGPVFGTTQVQGNGGRTFTNTDFNKVVGHRDGVFIWERGIRVFEELAGKEATYKGLCTRDFVIVRSGAKADDTKYLIEPAVDDQGNSSPSPMSDGDVKLWETWKNADGNWSKLVAKVTPKSYEAVLRIFQGAGVSGADGQGQDPPDSAAVPANPFDLRGVPQESAFGMRRS